MESNQTAGFWIDVAQPWLLVHGIRIVIILIAAFILTAIANKLIARGIRSIVVGKSEEEKVGEIKRGDTLIRIFSGVSFITITTISVLMIAQEAGLAVGPFLAGAGIVGIAVGFGGQYLIRDVISGFFIILENQYRIGDVVNLDGTGGLVEDITLRMTTLRDLDGTVHHIAHGEVKRVANLSKNFSRVNMNVGVGYQSDLDHVIQVVNEVGNQLASDPDFKTSIIKVPQFLRVDDFADSSIVIKIVGDTLPSKQWEVSGELRKRLKVAFAKAGIEIPFPQRVVTHIHESTTGSSASSNP